MDCRQAESLLALWAGNDLDEIDPARQVQAHLDACEHCRQRSREFVVAHTALQEARCDAPDLCNLWPRVKARLVEWERSPRFAKFNVWVPTAVAAVACSLLVFVASVEVQRKLQRQPARDLFRDDENLARSRGQLVSPYDLERWRETEFEAVPSTVAGPPRPLKPQNPAPSEFD
jgi:hypothetical protein